jgi:hypothetical protein
MDWFANRVANNFANSPGTAWQSGNDGQKGVRSPAAAVKSGVGFVVL